MLRPADTDEADWGAVRMFKAIMAMLKANYAASTDADVAALRMKLTQLNDQCPGEFQVFHRDFVRILGQLRATKEDAVSEQELVVWVKRAIKNSFVNSSVLLKWYTDVGAEITHEQILTKVGLLLVELANQDEDPYRVASGAKGTVAANSAESRGKRTSERRKKFGGCTICWEDGHWWKDCPNDECQACGAIIRRLDRTCPNWREHEPYLRFEGDIEPWNRGRERADEEHGESSKADQEESAPSEVSSNPGKSANRAKRGRTY
jgi:hypothetical protein